MVEQALEVRPPADGAPAAWKLFRQDVGHTETPEMRAEIVQWLERWL